MNTTESRLHVVDALRGFALIAIMLLHNLEHFDYYYVPQNVPAWLQTLDKGVWETLFFLFAGKSYAIFALLFGLTFFIQSYNQQKRGVDFRARFAWRLLLLLVFGLINSAFYQGDILMIYAILGFGLIPVSKLKTKLVLGLAALLMFQPFEWVNVMVAAQYPDVELANPTSWAYFGKMGEYIPHGSLWETVVGNLCNGRLAVMNWTLESGRVCQTLSLFMLGMLAGRKGLFKSSDTTKLFWKRTLVWALVAFVPLFLFKTTIETLFDYEALRRPLTTIVSSWANFAFMLVLMASFVLVYPKKWGHKLLRVFAPIGSMSLSNYMIQSILGSCLYYGFGLALYQYTGATACMLIGITLGTLQGVFSVWWLKKHRRGPLEGLWHRLTWLGKEKATN